MPWVYVPDTFSQEGRELAARGLAAGIRRALQYIRGPSGVGYVGTMGDAAREIAALLDRMADAMESLLVLYALDHPTVKAYLDNLPG